MEAPDLLVGHVRGFFRHFRLCESGPQRLQNRDKARPALRAMVRVV
jgi:hypothetical protein